MSLPEDTMVQETTVEKERREVGGRQLAMIVGGVLLFLLIVWFLFLRGGGEETEQAAPPVAPPATTPAPEKTAKGGKKAGKEPVETFEVFAPKDPFDPLITEDAGGETTDGGTTDDGTTDGGTTDGGTTDGGTTGDGTTGGGTTDGGGGGTSEDVHGHSVELIATLDNGSAQVQVDSTVYTVEEGETFAENFEVVSVSDECATLLFGDDQFTLCEGEEILK